MDIALASLGARAGAALDHLLAAVPAAVIGGAALMFLDPGAAIVIGIGTGITTTLIYFTVFEARQGGTPVKQQLGLRVAKQDGSEIGWRAALIRNLVRPIDFSTLYLTGIGFVLASEQDQRLGDRLAGTIVVEDGPGEIIERHEIGYANRAVGYLIAGIGLLPVAGLLV